MKEMRLSTDPFATLINLMGAALSGPVTRSAVALPEDPMPLRPEPVDRQESPSQPRNEGGLLERLEQSLWRQRQRELEGHLAGASDVAEVERRLRERERSLLQRYY